MAEQNPTKIEPLFFSADKKKNQPTEVDKVVHNNIKVFRKERKMTLEQLAAALGTSKQTIHRYENGIISNIPRAKVEELAEALGTTPAELMGWESFRGSAKRVPMLGSIACGAPIFAAEERGEYLTAASGVDADFCLLASGDSMTGARIYDGDVVFIKAQDTVSDGEIAAVIIGDEATLKRVYYYPEDEKLVLSPENPSYAPMVYVGRELEAVKILGKAVAFQSRL